VEGARAIGGGGGIYTGSTPSVPGLEVVDKRIPGPEGAPEVLIRIFTPENQEGLMPALLDMHPGGFVLGDIDADHGRMTKWAKELGIVVVGVDYRLAPENPFPAALEDCYAALVWMHDNASELSIDVDRIGVLGQSAGGGLAAALALLSRDRGGPNICFQYLDAPELDDRLQTASMQQFVDTPLWNSPNAVWSWKYYLGEDILLGSEDVSSYAAPARATDLSGLPPAYILVYEFDPLRDEDILYALSLLDAGADAELHVYPGTFHTSSLFAGASVSQRQNQDLLDALRRGLRIE